MNKIIKFITNIPFSFRMIGDWKNNCAIFILTAWGKEWFEVHHFRANAVPLASYYINKIDIDDGNAYDRISFLNECILYKGNDLEEAKRSILTKPFEMKINIEV